MTTFLSMVYIIFVNPSILGQAGMPPGAVFVAPCLIGAIGTGVMSLYANGLPAVRPEQARRFIPPAPAQGS